MRPIFGVIADDLTGGMETAAMLVAEGVACGFVTRPDRIADVDDNQAIVVAQKTRVVEAAEAVEKSLAAARGLLALDTRRLFFKYCATFDLTDQGNIGPVADALMSLTDARVTAYCPTSYELARSVFNGHLFVGTQLVSESPKRSDPLTPMTDPDLVRVLQRQTPQPVGLLPHRLVRGDLRALQAEVEQMVANGIRHLIADAIYAEDLDALAGLTVDWPLMTGNAPIVRHFPPIWRSRGWLGETGRKVSLPAVDGPGVVLAGSCAERTLEQLAAFERTAPVLYIDVASVADPSQAVADAMAWAAGHLDAGPLGIATSAGPDAVARSQARFGREGAAGLAEEILGRLAVALFETGVRRFVVAGGETSGTVVARLGIDRLEIGAYQAPGVARATAGMRGAIVALSLKSGKLGPVDMFRETLDSMLVREG